MHTDTHRHTHTHTHTLIHCERRCYSFLSVVSLNGHSIIISSFLVIEPIQFFIYDNKTYHNLVSCDTVQFSSVQSLSRVWLFATPWIAARQASLSITNSWSLLKLMSIKSVMPSSHLILCLPILLLPLIPPSIRVFFNESTLRMRWTKYWSFSFSISPSNEHPGLISFRMDWLDLLAVQGNLKSLLQHHSSKASIFGIQLSSPSNSHIHTWPLEKP